MDEKFINMSLDILKQYLWILENGDPAEVRSQLRQTIALVEYDDISKRIA